MLSQDREKVLLLKAGQEALSDVARSFSKNSVALAGGVRLKRSLVMINRPD
jgi:hypothetical protein